MNCIDCNNNFKPFVHNQTRCRTCVATNNKKLGKHKRESKVAFEKKCEWCSKGFEMTAPAGRYCSKQCNLETKRAKKYHLNRVDFLSLIASEVCQLCGSTGFTMDSSRYDSGLVIDHCHTTGVVRGMLCHNCNRALGLLQDDTTLLKRAITYLERATTIPQGSTLKRVEAQSSLAS
jgi:hypothetical protein